MVEEEEEEEEAVEEEVCQDMGCMISEETEEE